MSLNSRLAFITRGMRGGFTGDGVSQTIYLDASFSVEESSMLDLEVSYIQDDITISIDPVQDLQITIEDLTATLIESVQIEGAVG